MFNSITNHAASAYSATTDFAAKCAAKPVKTALAAVGIVGAAYGAYALNAYLNNNGNPAQATEDNYCLTTRIACFSATTTSMIVPGMQFLTPYFMGLSVASLGCL